MTPQMDICSDQWDGACSGLQLRLIALHPQSPMGIEVSIKSCEFLTLDND